jgi:hypothetical protein
MKHQLLIVIAVTALFTGLFGFYVGRFYEGRMVSNRFQQMRAGGPLKGEWKGPGRGQRMYYNGAPQNGITAPSNNPLAE